MATGVLARRQQGAGTIMGVLGIFMLFAAATLRFNAFTACMPLLVALLPRAWWRT